MRGPFIALLLLTALFGAGCQQTSTDKRSDLGSDGDDGLCTQEAAAGITVQLLLPRTALPGFRIEVRRQSDGRTEVFEGDLSGFYDDETGLATVSGAYEQAGVYDVTIKLNGTVRQIFRDQRVDAAPCHVKGVTVRYPQIG